MSLRRRVSIFASLSCALALCGACANRDEEPVTADQVTDFRALFSQNCTGCHGLDGKNGAAQTLNYPLYLAIIPRDTLQRVIENGRPGTPMPAFSSDQGGPLNAKQVRALVDGIEGTWAKPEAFRNGQLPPYSAEGAPSDVQHGRQLFNTACIGCHGPHGVVGPLENASYLTLVSDQSIRTSIIVGRPQLGMPDWRLLNRGHSLSDQDITDLTAYLSSRRPPIAKVLGTRQAGSNELESGTGQTPVQITGNEGSGNGPGSPGPRRAEGNAFRRGSSIRGGPGKSDQNTQPIKHQ